MKRTEKMWGLMGHWDNGRTFLYYKVAATRKDVVKWAEEATGKPWRELYRKGDRAVRVTVSYEATP